MRTLPIHDSNQLDMLAWKAICEWPTFTDIDVRGYSNDYAELSRWFLWDKVGRAIRFSSSSKSSEFERDLISANNIFSENSLTEPKLISDRLRRQFRSFFSLARKKQEQSSPDIPRFQRKSKHLVYVPSLSDRLINACTGLIQKNIQIAFLDVFQSVEWADRFHTSIEIIPDYEVAESIYYAIICGLKGFEVTLLDSDAAMLRSQLINLTVQVKSVQTELEILRPDAILVHGDNHPPFQAYVLAAKKMGIPAIMLQHGLDCEHNYLDEAYALAVTVWGPERLRRYREKSTWQPHISVTGNPEFDHLHLPDKIDPSGDYWLWVTRPHTPEKCYAPTRTPDEGITILLALIDALKMSPRTRLIIKPHPYDYRNQYEKIILDQNLQDSIELSMQNIQELIPKASLVITEDSSAGLDAMFAGKPLVHAHFAESASTMPFVDYGAALPGFCKEQLVESVLRASAFDDAEAQQLLTGQIDFIRDFAGPCDGNARNRFVEFVGDVLCQNC